MKKLDPYLARIESFNLKNGGGMTVTKVQKATIYTSPHQMRRSPDLTQPDQTTK